MKNQIAIELLKVTLDKSLPSVAADAIVVQVIKLLEKCGTSNPGYDGNAQCQKGGLHRWVDQEPQKAEECGCEGKSCKEGCSEDHTHKGFLCEICSGSDYQAKQLEQ